LTSPPGDVDTLRSHEHGGGIGDEMSFAEDVKPLFREEDRSSMDFAFDLWSYDDVKANAELILERVADGTMPCDEAWSEDKVQVFRSWIAEGCPP
jgi:hypothetical protein